MVDLWNNCKVKFQNGFKKVKRNLRIKSKLERNRAPLHWIYVKFFMFYKKIFENA